MGHAGGYRAVLKTVSANKTDSFVSGMQMALKYSCLYYIGLQADSRRHALCMSLPWNNPFSGKELMGLELNHPLHVSPFFICNVTERHLIHMEGIKYSWIGLLQFPAPVRLFMQAPSVFRCQRTALIHSGHAKINQVFQHCQVCTHSRHDSAPVLQPKIPCCIIRSHLYGLYGIRAKGDRLSDNIINMPHGNQVAGMLIIGYQHAALIIGRLKKRHQGL